MKRFPILTLIAVMAFVLMPNTSRAHAASPETCHPGDQLWVGTFGYGANCLDSAGWHTYTQENGAIASDQVNAISVCAGKVWIVTTLGITLTDGSQWNTMNTDFTGGAIACHGNDVYIAHQDGLSHWNGSGWDTIDAKNFGSGANVGDLKDVVIAPDGTLWVATANSIAKGDGKTWTVFEQGKGFTDQQFFQKLALDSQGNLWTNSSSGLYRYDGKTWNTVDTDTYAVFDTLTIGPSDKVYVGSYSDGLDVFDGSAWSKYDRTSSKISSDQVHSLTVDGQGRIWVGTEYGLDVFDGKAFTPFLMADSGLADNSVVALTAVGKGPVLPAPVSKKTGSLSGTVVNGTTPVSNATVEVCTEFIGSTFSGSTPCGDNPFFKDGKTDANGKFTIADLPPGRYGIVIQGADGNWVRLTDSIAESRFEVQESADYDLGTVDLSKSS